jgi:glyoxylase-like metal-dependent hydrolase (beta-lactamase superfamily II)
MTIRIQRFTLGITSCYLVQANGIVLVDCGAPWDAKALKQTLQGLSFELSEINLILLTHAHLDHVGTIRLAAQLTGGEVAIHHSDAPYLQKGEQPSIYPATPLTSLLAPLVRLTEPLLRFPSYEPEIILRDEPFSLERFGIPGEVVHTPGHTAGSVSLVLESGEAIVGDLAMNGFPAIRRRPGLPIVAADIDAVKASWRTLLERGVHTAYPGHGKPFSLKIAKHLLVN